MSKTKVICWDCENIINMELPEEVKRTTPRDLDGNHFIICYDCGNNEDED